MAKKSAKKTSLVGPAIEKNGPKTRQGKINRMMTGDGRRNYNNLSLEERMNLMMGIAPTSKKKKSKK
ncbi:hypothetical protein SAMN04488589_2280 [Methanolobus vulcani]|jgi:hypothetical protein|uniref:Uncharacterized protein n=1 Tax=Methanolobus vulcani TaxID=38026 RepID=A0A7Z7FF71_9EURY|nr:hypothetical protein [Methanolobus vulcani]MDK2947423.1 hypothetical protein [Methanolobus sp.]SDG15091.1 hypothetical protein SAMN04488589_2280 [Methanolobus vulcani]